MYPLSTIRSALLLIALAPTPVFAITADQVWADWQRLASGAGAPLTATPRRDGDRLVLTRLALTLGSPDDPAAIRLDRLVLRDNPDGTVTVLLPDSFPLTLDLPGPIGPNDPDRLIFTTAAPDLAITIAGLGPTSAFDITAPSLTVTLAPLDLPPGAQEELTVTLAMADVMLRNATDFLAPETTISTTLTLGTLHADTAVSIPDEVVASLTLDLSALTAGIDFRALATALARKDPSPAEVIQTLKKDVSLFASLTHGPVSMTLDVSEAGKPPVDIALTSASGEARIITDETGFRWDLASGATRLDGTLNDPTVPFTKFGLGYTETAYGVAIGLGTLTEPQTFSLYARLTDLTLAGPLWAKIDPASAFPRTPFSFDLALNGLATLKPEALMPGWQPKSDTDLPFDIIGLTLDTLLLKGLGASLTGSGSLAFDTTDTTTYDGFPAPTGRLSFAATGIYALIDMADRAALLAPDELTGFRFGLAFIAKPGDSPDTLTSTVEFKDKSLLLNGQKLR